MPEANILSSPSGVEKEGETLTFTGEGSDDNEIVGYEWNSSIDGIFGTGNYVAISTLSNGTHTVYFRVQDNHGFWSEPDTITFTVNGRPISDILNPSNNTVVLENTQFNSRPLQRTMAQN